MPVIGTSGSTSGDGKRRVAAWPKRPRPSSTLPCETSRPDPAKSAYEGQSGRAADIVRGPTLTPLRHARLETFAGKSIVRPFGKA
jgi:hypothetical protein